MKTRYWAVTTGCLWVLVVWAQPAGAYCATEPPPAGLVERCRSLELTVPGSYAEFEGQVRSWMEGCVSRGRAAGMVDGDPTLTEVWDWIGAHPGTRHTILPDYEPNQFTDDDGRNCYGVDEVSFRLDRPRGEVEVGDEAEMELEYGPTDAQVKQAARRAKRALDQHSGDGAAVGRLRCVLDRMERSGKSFDDVYYDVAPTGDLVGDWNPPACYKEGRYGEGGYEYHCRSGQDALATCRRGMTERLVTRIEGGASDADIAEGLLLQDDQIKRGVDHLSQMQNSGSAAMICKGVRTHVMPDVAARAKRGTLYSCY